jgi:hydrogenase nickel incorporation protein HypA/HybF
MHELAIAEALLEQVGRELDRAGHKGPVLRLELAIGRLTGVHCESLRFALDLLAPGTWLENAEVTIHQTSAFCRCQKCRHREEIEELPSVCPRCGSTEVVIDGGRELLLQTIEVAD